MIEKNKIAKENVRNGETTLNEIRNLVRPDTTQNTHLIHWKNVLFNKIITVSPKPARRDSLFLHGVSSTIDVQFNYNLV